MENNRESPKNRGYKIGALLWSLIILLLTLSPADPDQSPFFDIPHLDKIGHFGLFFILAILLIQGWKPVDRFAILASILTYCLGLGFVTEYFQANIPGRSSDIWDFIADGLGSGIGIFATRFINFRFWT